MAAATSRASADCAATPGRRCGRALRYCRLSMSMRARSPRTFQRGDGSSSNTEERGLFDGHGKLRVTWQREREGKDERVSELVIAQTDQEDEPS